MIDSVFRTGKNYYSQVFVEECKKKTMSEYITDDIEISSDDSDREVSAEEDSNDKNSDEENFNEEN